MQLIPTTLCALLHPATTFVAANHFKEDWRHSYIDKGIIIVRLTCVCLIHEERAKRHKISSWRDAIPVCSDTSHRDESLSQLSAKIQQCRDIV